MMTTTGEYADGKTSIRYVVVSTPRSGTAYMARLLSALGLHCSHERHFTPRGMTLETDDLGTGLSGDASWLAAPYLRLVPRETLVLHQLRDPVPTLNSIIHGLQVDPSDRRDMYAAFLTRHLPRPTAAAIAERAIDFWVYWHRMIEDSVGERPYLRYRVEDVSPALLSTLVSRITGRTVDVSVTARALREVPTTENTRGAYAEVVTRAAIPRGVVERFGYASSSPLAPAGVDHQAARPQPAVSQPDPAAARRSAGPFRLAITFAPKPVIQHIRRQSPDLFFVYTGGARGLMLNPATFFAQTRLLDHNVVIFQDQRGEYYRRGVSDELNSFERFVHWQRRLLDTLPHVKRIYCLGTSMGGYAALLCGHVLAAAEVWAFAPKTVLPRGLSLGGLTIPPEEADLSLTLGTGPTPTRYHIYYNERHEPDRRQAEHVVGCAGVILHPQPGDDHNVVDTLLALGTLDAVVRPSA